MSKKNYFMRDRYYRALGKKCFKCNESYFLEDYANKSDWKQYRKCGSCNHKIIALDTTPEPLEVYKKTEEYLYDIEPKPYSVKQTEDYYVFLQ